MKTRRTFVALALVLLLALAVTTGQAQAPGPGGLEGRQSAVDLLIITPEEFAPVLEPLVAFKNATGIPTIMATLEEIDGRPALSGDQAQRVKQAIAQESGIKYVMLVGDVDRFPVRWVASLGGDRVEYFYPSDLYYADLYESDGATFETWDSDGDGLYGEHRCGAHPAEVNADQLDLHPDVAVGRVPASTIEQLESYVAKIIRYESLTFGWDWFYNVLLIAGDGRTYSRWCDPGINFGEVQTDLGDTFTYRTWINDRYYMDKGEESGRPCVCQAGEALGACLARTLLPNQAALDVFTVATPWTDTVGVTFTDFEDVGFLGWHDHTSAVRDYTRVVNNADHFSVAFADGCGDGNFAGPQIGSRERFGDPYVTADGHTLQVHFEEELLAGSRYYRIDKCILDGTEHGLDGAHCADGIYPAMTLADDFGLDPTATMTVTREGPYVTNLPPPAPLQIIDFEWNPELKLFNKFSATGQETGWAGMVGATKGATFPFNGEMLELFFEGYADPHDSVAGRNRLGDAWRSMMERWLDIVFDASGDFSLDHVVDVYHYAPEWCSSYRGLEHALMYALSGDPSLRIGGIDIPADTLPPVTSDDADNAWHNKPVEIRLTPVDAGSPPSGVRTTRYRVGTTGDWHTGTRLTINAPSDHSNDGIHTVQYYSVDFMGNVEPTRSTRVRIDTVKPWTVASVNDEAARLASTGAVPSAVGSPVQDPTDGMQALLFYPAAALPPERPCYNKSVDVTLDADDDRSGVADTWVWIDRSGYWPQSYTEPFPVSAWDYVALHEVEYWSEDNAGNRERPHLLTLCVTNFEAGLMKEETRILAALEEIVAMRMRQDLASTLPPIKGVSFAYQFRDEPDAQWTPIGTDYVGTDGWSAEWKTTEVPNGRYGIELMVWGFPPARLTVPLADPLLYREEVEVVVSNVSAAYDLALIAWPPQIDRGQSIEYTLEFHNDSDEPLQDLTMTCVLDPGYLDELEVLDGGTLDAHGMPTWSLEALQAGDTWKAHFVATTRPDILPGTVIANQAFLTADRIPRLLSDDPSTLNASAEPAVPQADWTAVTVNLIDGSIGGQVVDAATGVPIAASVTIAGPVSQVIETGATGQYEAYNLPTGAYSVSVQAEDYYYLTPAGPVAVALDGTVENVQVSFQLKHADTMAPVSTLHRSADEIVLAHGVEISGTAYDYPPGSGVQKVELSILRAGDDRYWNGATWVDDETWLLASGTTAWSVQCANLTWNDDSAYMVRSRATDNAGNVERPTGSATTVDLQAPSPIAPAPGSVVDDPPTFQWSLVLDSRYHLQVDDDPVFQSAEIDASEIDLGSYTPLHLPAGTYAWRVRAVDADLGYPQSDWSEVWTLTIRAPIYLPIVVKN